MTEAYETFLAWHAAAGTPPGPWNPALEKVWRAAADEASAPGRRAEFHRGALAFMAVLRGVLPQGAEREAILAAAEEVVIAAGDWLGGKQPGRLPHFKP